MLSTSFTTRGGAVASALTRRASRAVFGRGQLGMVDASVLGKLQGAQLFLGSIVLYMWGAQRVQYRMASSSSGGGGSNGAPKKERKKSGVYTRTGDQGTSSLYNGERRSKSDVVFDALGSTDELNAHIGLAKEHCTAKNVLEPLLSQIQSRLMDVGAAIATPQPNSSVEKVMRTRFEDKHVQQLEAWIDEIDSRLPPLKNFILPSGGLCSANLHVARTVCRRAERLVTPLMQQGHVEQAVVQYLNRLSDFLFVAARWAAQCDGKTETIWTKA